MTGTWVDLVVIHHDRPASCAVTARAFADQAGVRSVTVVESSTSPTSRRRLRELLAGTGTEILEAGGNVGFGPGANLGLRRWLADADGTWVGIAPHDAVPVGDCVRRLLREVASRPDAGLVCAEFGAAFNLVPAVDKVLGGYYRAAARGAGWQDVDYPHGTLMLARRVLLEEVGVFDERYFAYCEEVDLGLRARQAGWKVGLVWGAVVTNGSLPDQDLAEYLQLRNTLLLLRERFGARAVRRRVVLAGADVAVGALRRPGRLPLQARLAWRAVRDERRGSFGAPPEAILNLIGRRPGRETRPRPPNPSLVG